MTLRERRRFMRELTANILKHALTKAAQMPDDWDGHELRRYLADQFEESSITLRPGRPDYRRRLRDYRATVLNHNL